MTIIRIPAYAAELYDNVSHDPRVTAMKQFTCHGGTTVYDHSRYVTAMACRIANLFHVDKEKYGRLVLAGLLHDFYCYEYHGHRTKMGGWHAWRHPAVALDNAKAITPVGPRLANAIRAHMFPGTLFHMPRYAEAWAVNAADKICSVLEYLHMERRLDMALAPA